MRYEHRFRVEAPLERVRRFHERSASMADITPPPTIVRIHRAPERLQEGDEMSFTLWLGPLPVRWLARIEDVSEHGFRDRQLRGPFRSWVHTHRFERERDGATVVHDRIEARVRLHPLWGPVGLVMWATLPLLFAYRARQTRRLVTAPAQPGTT